MSSIQYLPVATAIPMFAEVEGVATKAEWGGVIAPDIWGVFQSANNFTIRQHMQVAPKHCCKCPPCVKQENVYSIYAGYSQDSTMEFLRVDEVSDDWNRCCCAPYHPLKLEVRQYIPLPGDGSKSDYSHISQDLRNNFGQLTGNKRELANQTTQFYKQNPVLMTIQRHDGMRCCVKQPCKCLSSFVCSSWCQDGADLYAGALQDEPEKEVGRPFNNDPSKLIGTVIQPNYGGGFTPTVHLKTADSSEPFAKVEGPCFFGGWLECCVNFRFAVSSMDQKSRTGDLANIVKQKPASMSGAFRELFSNADVYSIGFNEAAKLNAAQKATVLAGQLLADYMWFDGNTEKCKDTDQAIYCYLCYFSCYGQICPVYIAIPKKQ